jgi:transposase
MEACSSAHHWGRQLLALGFEVRLIPPAHVKPYVRRKKAVLRRGADCSVR